MSDFTITGHTDRIVEKYLKPQASARRASQLLFITRHVDWIWNHKFSMIQSPSPFWQIKVLPGWVWGFFIIMVVFFEQCPGELLLRHQVCRCQKRQNSMYVDPVPRFTNRPLPAPTWWTNMCHHYLVSVGWSALWDWSGGSPVGWKQEDVSRPRRSVRRFRGAFRLCCVSPAFLCKRPRGDSHFHGHVSPIFCNISKRQYLILWLFSFFGLSGFAYPPKVDSFIF